MNTLKTILYGIVLLCSTTLSAQKKDPLSDLPYSNKIEIKDQALNALFSSQDRVSVQLAPGFIVEGQVQNKTDHGNSVNSILIHVDSAPGGIFSLSRYTNPQGRVLYSGHLMKLHEPDGYILLENDHGYFLVKTQQRFLVAE